MNQGKTLGLILVGIGAAILLLVVLWALSNTELAATAKILAVFFGAIVSAPLIGFGIYTLTKGQAEASEEKVIAKQRKLLNMVMTQGQVNIAEATLELGTSRDETKQLIYDLIGKQLFSGYVDLGRGYSIFVGRNQIDRGRPMPQMRGQAPVGGKRVDQVPILWHGHLYSAVTGGHPGAAGNDRMRRSSGMSSNYEKVKGERGWLESLIGKIPGYKGYKEKEMRREADSLLRGALVRDFTLQLNRLAPMQSALLDQGGIELMDDIGAVKTSLQTLIDRIKNAAQGYAGFFDAVRVKEDELDRLEQFDAQLVDEVSRVSAAFDFLDKAIQENGDVKAAIASARSIVQRSQRPFQQAQQRDYGTVSSVTRRLHMARIIDVIEWPDQGPNDIVQRVPEQGPGDVRLGSQVIVRGAQVAVFYRDGKALDAFKEGRHTLSTGNLPILSGLIGLATNAARRSRPRFTS